MIGIVTVVIVVKKNRFALLRVLLMYLESLIAIGMD